MGKIKRARDKVINKTMTRGVLPYLSGLVCAYHPAGPGSSQSTPSMLLSFIVKFVIYFHVKRTKINNGFGPFLEK